MPSKTIVDKEYIQDMREIYYLGHDETRSNMNSRGHIFKLMSNEDVKKGYHSSEAVNTEKTESLEKTESAVSGEKFEVMDWIERTPEYPYDFILRETRNNKYYLANLHGRADGWPLFAIQEGKYVCSRLKMGSEWNCRLCDKYFDAVCQGRYSNDKQNF